MYLYQTIIKFEKFSFPTKLNNFTEDAKLASKDDVLQQTGCEFGAVPPVGHLQKLAVIVDLSIFKPESVEFSAGLKTKSIRLKSADFRAALKKMGAAGFELTE